MLKPKHWIKGVCMLVGIVGSILAVVDGIVKAILWVLLGI
jgi:hypothetical protein